MPRFIAVIVPVLVVGALVAACGGGGTKTVNVPGGGQVSVSGKLPSNFPSSFPVYKGASVQGSYTGTQNGITGSVVTWTTKDSIDKVGAFYNEQFKNGPWKSQTSGNTGGSMFWVADSADGKQAAYVGASSDGKETTIIATVGDNAPGSGSAPSSDTPTASDTPDTSSSSGSTPSTTLPDQASLPSDYPSSRVPLPSGARVTSATSLTSNGRKTFYIELYAKQSPSALSDYFKNEMPKHGWNSTLAAESSGTFLLTFDGATASDPAGNESLSISVDPSDVAGYAKASIIAAVK